MNKTKYTNYDDLPLMLSVPDVASVLGISRAGAYELVRSDGFPSLRIGSRIVVPKEKLHEKILNDAGIEHLRFHDLRHSFATYALQSGADVKTLSCMLGHYSAGFTLNTYCHATRDMQADAARKIGGFMSAQTGIG